MEIILKGGNVQQELVMTRNAINNHLFTYTLDPVHVWKGFPNDNATILI